MEKTESSKKENIPLRSEVVQEIMGSVPHVLIRWGNTLILILTLGILIISYFIHYPVILKGEAELNTTMGSTPIYASISGMLVLNIKNGDFIKKDKKIAQIIASDSSLLELFTPITGKVYTTSFFVDKQIVNKGELLFRTLSRVSTTYTAVVKIPSSFIKNIEVGQEVRISFSNIGNQENSINGNVQEISKVADEKGLVAIQILCVNNNKINQSKNFFYIPGMKGNAEIIVENPRLIEHFLSELKNIINL